MPTLIPETVLPNGNKVFFLHKAEVPILHEQIQEYFKNGIEVHEGDTVFDVGANIGLFTLKVNELCNQNVNVYAFEPIPDTFEVLQRNAQRWNPERLKVFPCGLSDKSQTVTFSYYPNSPALSNAYPDDSKELTDQLKATILRNLEFAPQFVRRLRFLPPFLRSFVFDKLGKRSFQTQQVICQMITVSDIIHEYNIQRIDLLKVDVEKSELNVLLGIEKQHWSKIKQLCIEIHDLENRVEKIIALLKVHGLSKITVEQEPIFKGSNIFSLYALRPND